VCEIGIVHARGTRGLGGIGQESASMLRVFTRYFRVNTMDIPIAAVKPQDLTEMKKMKKTLRVRLLDGIVRGRN